jgi:hypothetical protein
MGRCDPHPWIPQSPARIYERLIGDTFTGAQTLFMRVRNRAGVPEAVDLADGRHADPIVAPWVAFDSLDGHIEFDLTHRVLDRQVAEDTKLRAAERLDSSGLESDVGVALGVEEVGRAKVCVPIWLIGVDARGLRDPHGVGVGNVRSGDLFVGCSISDHADGWVCPREEPFSHLSYGEVTKALSRRPPVPDVRLGKSRMQGADA